MSVPGQKRRPLQQTAAGRCPLFPDIDRDCAALQYVATGQTRTSGRVRARSVFPLSRHAPFVDNKPKLSQLPAAI
jgi:hypothetical protein